MVGGPGAWPGLLEFFASAGPRGIQRAILEHVGAEARICPQARGLRTRMRLKICSVSRVVAARDARLAPGTHN